MENKQLQIAKDTIAKKYGFKDFKHAIGGDYVMCGISQKLMPNFMDSVAIEYHRLMSEWVSIDERFPEKGEIVDIFLEDGYGRRNNYKYEGCGFFYENKYDKTYTIIDFPKVKHWREIPQPPK